MRNDEKSDALLKVRFVGKYLQDVRDVKSLFFAGRFYTDQAMRQQLHREEVNVSNEGGSLCLRWRGC